MTRQATIAVILSGCGHLDGAEIHESTLTLLAIHRHQAEYMCFAPDKQQHHVLNHLSGEEMTGERNVLIESARIARGKIQDISSFKAAEFDALVLPGGFGVAKNLSTFAFQGAACTIEPEIEKAVKAMHEAGKPIGALCIAPAVLAKLLPGVTLTIGADASTASTLEEMGARHQVAGHGEIVVDATNKVVTTPCYMLDSRVDQVADGADALITAVLQMVRKE